MNREIAYTRQAYKNTLSNRALLQQFLKLGKFVWREFLHSMIRKLNPKILKKNIKPFLVKKPSFFQP